MGKLETNSHLYGDPEWFDYSQLPAAGCRKARILSIPHRTDDPGLLPDSDSVKPLG